ncbi:cytochrome P450 2C8 [Nephila pilipes]|uniref:Cytochrome P450 2C8 n=1 Tax=Nephila pilipes TaxID=299642 RepID=A0A8X6Q310_NEPPI|nr:cytochrome P450 2C8 [Nephila pilipes]
MHSKKRKLPPGPFNLPIVGYLPFLGEKPYLTFQKLSEKYGPVFRLLLGKFTAVIITDYNVMKETFSKSASLDRPPDFSQTIPDGLGLASINGHEWTTQRRYSMRVLNDVGLGKSKWRDFVQDEVDEYVQLLEKQKGEPFEPKLSLIASIANNISSLIFGYRLPLESPQMSVIIQAIYSFPKYFNQTGLFLIPGMFTFFKITGLNQGMTEFTAFNNLFREEVNKKKKKTDETNEISFVDDYLQKLKEEESKKETSFQETHLIGNIQSLVIGGTETTTNTLLWLFLVMVIHPKIQQKVQEEVDSVLGKSKPQWTEHLKLPYTYATILECMRWRTMVPGNLLRCCLTFHNQNFNDGSKMDMLRTMDYVSNSYFDNYRQCIHTPRGQTCSSGLNFTLKKSSSSQVSQCVNCPFLALQGYSFSCFGNTAFPRNMTPAQAQCMIQKCQDGVKQTSVYLGRKKREESDEPIEQVYDQFVSQYKANDSKEYLPEGNMQVVGEIDIYVDEFDDEEMF